MRFTTKLSLKKDKEELYPDNAVLTQLPYNVEDKGANTKFILNTKAMNDFGYILDTPNVNKITWGIDDDNESDTYKQLLIANLDSEGKTDKDSNITANNSFSNQKFMDKLVKQFGIDPTVEHNFEVMIVELDGINVANLVSFIPESYEAVVESEEIEESIGRVQGERVIF